MTPTKTLDTGLKARLRSGVARVKRDERGSATYFSIAMLMMMLAVGGISVDLMQNEMTRTQVQNTLDRAVLAAADLDQPLDPAEVVQDYFNKAGMGQYLTSVGVDEGLNFRTVTARADATTRTRFMQALGVPELAVPARSTAEERISNVEISMVLDISGSMGRNNKMENLHDAAETFINTVLTDANEDLVSVSIVPYTAQVSAGENIFNGMNMNRLSGNPGWCVDFEDTDFLTTSLRMDGSYEHMQFFDAGWNYDRPVSNPGCPGRDDGIEGSDVREYEQIVAFSQNPAVLTARVNQFAARANTAIHIGMKWGVALLDPSFKPVVQYLGLRNAVDSAFGARPALYSDTETLKTILLMTDGENVNTVRIADWAYSRRNYRVHWTRYPLHWYLNNYVYSSEWGDWRYTKYTDDHADDMLSDICQAARDSGIVVWTIGFEVNNDGADVMRDCASSPSHFFRVEGVEITEAFEAIAKQINQLRLTQ